MPLSNYVVDNRCDLGVATEGDRILARCREVLADEYKAVSAAIRPSLPDERFRRVGQSAAAASLPALEG